MGAALATYAIGFAIGSSASGVFAVVGFLFLLPAFLSAFVCALVDPGGTWGSHAYLRVPFALFGLVTVAAVVFLREGLICLAMLALPWLGSGVAGCFLFYRLRRRVEGARFHASFLLPIPLLAIQAENSIPPPWQEWSVQRGITIAAPPDRVWPLLLSLPAIGPDEGRWTISHDLLGVPRPHAAVVTGSPTGPIRHARWHDGVQFAEALTESAPSRALEWRFLFPDPTLHHPVDRHINPRGAMLDVASGGYKLDPLPQGRTRLTLITRYRMRSWAAPYAALWGQLILGDIQNNILAIVADRAGRTGDRLTGRVAPR